MAKANIFVNTATETTYFYQDLDKGGRRLHGASRYSVTFPAGGLPPARGFWSLTLYNEHHFFHPNDLQRYSLGTKNKNLRLDPDGSLTLYASAEPPDDPGLAGNWLPAPQAEFSLYLRAYWPDDAIVRAPGPRRWLGESTDNRQLRVNRRTRRPELGQNAPREPAGCCGMIGARHPPELSYSGRFCAPLRTVKPTPWESCSGLSFERSVQNTDLVPHNVPEQTVIPFLKVVQSITTSSCRRASVER